MKKYILYSFILCLSLSLLAQEPYKQVEDLIEQKEYVRAEKIMLNVVRENQQDAKAIELLGDTCGHQKKWDNAITQYKKLTELNPNNANYHYKYGGALGMKALEISKLKALGIIGDIKYHFNMAAELDPNHIDARWALVELYTTLPSIVGGSKSKSLKFAEELQQLSEVDGYLAKGYIYEYSNEPKKAETYYREAIKVGGSLKCYEKLTNLYEKESQPENAILNIEHTLEMHNRNALHYQIGKVCADYNVQLDKGIICLQNYLKNYTAADGVPKEWALYRLAQIYKHKKDQLTALEYINKALALKSDFDQALQEKKLILAL